MSLDSLSENPDTFIANPMNREDEENSEQFQPRSVSSGNEPSASKSSENINELLMQTIENIGKDLCGMKHSLSEILDTQQHYGEELSHLREETRLLREDSLELRNRIQIIENRNSDARSPLTYGKYPEREAPRQSHSYIGVRESPQCDRISGAPPAMNTNDNYRIQPRPRTPAKPPISIKPHTYDGSEDFEEYLSQFKILVELHGWDYREKSLYLASCLTGNARTVLGELSEAQSRDFESLVRVLNMRFGSMERSEMFRAKLKNRVKGEKESLSELAQSIKKLIRQAYPTADPNLLNILALDHYIDALPDPNMRLRLRESKVKGIEEAEIMAIRLETYKMADAQRGHSINVVSHKSSSEEDKSLLALLKNIEQKLDKIGQRSQNTEKYPREDNYQKHKPQQSNDKGDNQNKYKNNSKNRHYHDNSRRTNYQRDNGPQFRDNYQSNDNASNSWGGSRRQGETSPTLNH
jgi:hypothetical protein